MAARIGIVRFILGIAALIVVVQILTTLHFTSTHWPDDHPIHVRHYIARNMADSKLHVEGKHGEQV